jgi:hypothetical protein
MAPPRKKKRAPGEGHPVHLRFPSDVFKIVEARAEKERLPINRAVINLIAENPALQVKRSGEYILEEMKIVLAQYGSRITLAELSEPMLQAIDAVLAAKTDGELQSRIDRLRVLRANMLKHEQEAKQIK